MNLEELADEALKQIEEKKYETELIDLDVKEIIKIGIAFQGKNAVVRNRWAVFPDELLKREKQKKNTCSLLGYVL